MFSTIFVASGFWIIVSKFVKYSCLVLLPNCFKIEGEAKEFFINSKLICPLISFRDENCKDSPRLCLG